MNKNTNQRSPFIIFIIGTLFFTIVFNIIFITPEENEQRVRLEAVSIFNVAGQQVIDNIVRKAHYIYQHTMINSGIEYLIDNLFAVKNSYQGQNAIMQVEQLTDNFGQNLKLVSYQLAFRLSVLSEWLITLAALFAGFIVDGYYRRKINQYESSNASIGMTKVWWSIVLTFSFTLTLYLFLPISLGVMAFYFPVTYFLLLSLSVRGILIRYHPNF
ncbi:DUF4400 domain-containing protein [Pseudoalteromonas sp. T1lg23B]|uniref:DUF4400 domain-containing protein n=1 Tax=Pseudoalteromonas sp. T1lg23B TaxID=2077097 RepID=UPI000CF65CC9|nr:DUF4400 domain-containing protein [Pseudoalteromonas sp. T1lg23B]